jgi:hypothetical protein
LQAAGHLLQIDANLMQPAVPPQCEGFKFGCNGWQLPQGQAQASPSKTNMLTFARLCCQQQMLHDSEHHHTNVGRFNKPNSKL